MKIVHSTNANNLERKHIYYINTIELVNSHFSIWCIDKQKYIFNGISETCVSDFNYSKEEIMEQLNH